MDKVVKSNFIAFNDVQFVGRVFHHHQHQVQSARKDTQWKLNWIVKPIGYKNR